DDSRNLGSRSCDNMSAMPDVQPTPRMKRRTVVTLLTVALIAQGCSHRPQSSVPSSTTVVPSTSAATSSGVPTTTATSTSTAVSATTDSAWASREAQFSSDFGVNCASVRDGGNSFFGSWGAHKYFATFDADGSGTDTVGIQYTDDGG